MDKQIRDSDFVVMVCTETYYQRVMGEEQPGKGLGVRWEGHLIYQAIYSAESMNTKFIPVLFESGNYADIPTPVQSTTFYFAQTEDGYEDLYRRLTDQPHAIKPALGKLRSLPAAERKSEGALGRLVNVPDLPPHFLERPGDLQTLKDTVLAGLTKPVGLTGTGKIGVQGMGGIGKTVLAAALAHESEVRQAFPDGIYWQTVGQMPNLLDLQNKLLRRLTGLNQALTTEEEAKDALRDALEGRRALLMLDDVWGVGHADAFSVTAPPARQLITTRNAEVLVGVGAEEHRVDVLPLSESLKMLAQWVGEKSPDKLPVEAAEVAKECGCLPLALAMIGAMIRRSKQSLAIAWQDALDCLRASDLEEIKRSFPGYPYPDLLRAIEVSVEALDESDRERYLDLAVFPEDQPIPETALRVLWELDARRTRKCMNTFAERSLATIAAESSADVTSTLSLHDLQHDLIRKRRERELPGLHLRLVESWDALPHLPDPYAWRRVVYHLAQAGRKEDLRQLLLNFDYLQAKLAATDPNALIADHDYLPEDKELQLVQSAIRLSVNVLARDARQLAGQLIGRLLSSTSPSIQAMLKQAAERKVWPWFGPLKPSLAAPGGSLIRTLEGHTSTVWAVAVTSDGRRAVSASDDRTLRVWDLETGQTLCTLECHTFAVRAVAVTPDGRRAVSASRDQTLRFWDLESGQTLQVLQGHTESVWAVAVTPDGRRAVSASYSGILWLWDLESGQTISTLKGHTRLVSAVAVTPDGSCAVSASDDQTLRLWDLKSGQTIRTFEGHTRAVRAATVTPDGRRAVSASDDRTLRVWDLKSDQTIPTPQCHTDWVTAVALTRDGLRGVSASRDQTLRLWDLESGQTIRTLQGHADSVGAVAVTPDGRLAVSGSDDRTLRLWDLESGKKIATFTGESRMNSCAIIPDSQTIISGDALGRMHFLRLVEPDPTKPAPEDIKIQLLRREEPATHS
jgi:WD40 repeat protein